jgi:hypothetical protein
VAGGGGATDADPADHTAADGTQGYHFKATGTYAALLGWGAATDGGVPEGRRPLVDVSPHGPRHRPAHRLESTVAGSAQLLARVESWCPKRAWMCFFVTIAA